MASVVIGLTSASTALDCHLVDYLRETKGFKVRGILPSAASVAVAAEKIEVVRTDFSNKESLQSACSGLKYVIHNMLPEAEKMEHVEDFCSKTTNLLSACAAEGNTVQRVVVLSSDAAFAHGATREDKQPLGAETWGSEEKMEKDGLWRHLAYTRSEKAAIQFDTERSSNMSAAGQGSASGFPHIVTVCLPTLLAGRPISSKAEELDPASKVILSYMKGDVKKYTNNISSWLHMDDAVEFICNVGLEGKDAAGQRYACVFQWIQDKDICMGLHMIDRNAPVPQECETEDEEIIPAYYSRNKAQDAYGKYFKNLHTFLSDTVKGLRELKHLPAEDPSAAAVHDDKPKEYTVMKKLPPLK